MPPLARSLARARLLALAVPVVVALPRPAFAWVDANVTSDDVVVTVSGGSARIEHRIALRIAGGPLRNFEIKGVDEDAAPEADGYVVPLREAMKHSLVGAQPIVVERIPEKNPLDAEGRAKRPTLQVRFESEKGLPRGVYQMVLHYTTELGKRIVPSPTLARITWTGPVWEDGFDSARVTFDLPASPTPPRADIPAPDDATSDGPRTPMVLAQVRRGVNRDQVELLRPYAPKGEAITWTLQADSRVVLPAPRAPKPPPPPPLTDGLTDRAQELSAIAALVAVIFGLVVAKKSEEAARHARARHVEPSPMLPLPAWLRAAVAGICLGAGIYAELALARATVGAVLVVMSMIAAAHTTPGWTSKQFLRGPGRWLPMSLDDALKPPPPNAGAYLDLSTGRGKALFVASLGAVLGLAASLWYASVHAALLVAADSAVLFAIFGTGRIGELPPDPARAPTRVLRRIARRVRRAFPEADVRIGAKVRMPDVRRGEGGDGKPTQAAAPDEVRLTIAPRSLPIGASPIEVGVVYAPGLGGAIGLPEVLVRWSEGSPSEVTFGPLFRGCRVLRGRKEKERVVLLRPVLPTVAMTSSLVLRLIRRLGATQPHQRGSTVKGDRVRNEMPTARPVRDGAGDEEAA